MGETLDTAGELAERASVHLDRAYDSESTRGLVERRGPIGVISERGKPVPLEAGMAVGRREDRLSWHDAHKKKLAWCTEREGRVIDFWLAFSNVVIVVRRLIRKAWSRYRWEGRPRRRP